MTRGVLAALAAGLMFGAAACGTETDAPLTSGVVEVKTVVTPTYDGVFTIAFGGDVNFEDELRPVLDDPGLLDPVTAMFGDADLVMVNLETALTTRGEPEPKTYTFRAPPSALTTLAAAGVHVVSMANNHGVDFGADGLADTLAAKTASPIPVVGIGATADEAFTPFVTKIEGTSISVLAATQVPDHTVSAWSASPRRGGVASARDTARLVQAVRDAAAATDLVVVYLHWGGERVSCPIDEQRTLARQLADAGADIVVGAHAHIQLGSGWLDDTYVSYGLGNFIWYTHNSEPEGSTGVLRLTIRDGRVVDHHLRPAMTPAGGGVPSEVTGRTADTVINRWTSLRDCAGLSASPTG